MEELRVCLTNNKINNYYNVKDIEQAKIIKQLFIYDSFNIEVRDKEIDEWKDWRNEDGYTLGELKNKYNIDKY